MAYCPCGTKCSTPPCTSCSTIDAMEESFANRETPEFTRAERARTGVEAPSQEGNSVLPDWQALIERRGGR